MNYLYPSSKDENWRKTRPSLFKFPDSVPDSSLKSFIYKGACQDGVHILQLGEAGKRFPHMLDGCRRSAFANDFSKFIAYNAKDGFFVFVENEAELSLPLSLMGAFVSEDNVLLNNLIIISSGAKVTLIENIGDEGKGQGLISTDVIIGANAEFNYRRFWRWNRMIYGDMHFFLSENSRLELTTYCETNTVAKVEQRVELKGQESEINEYFADFAEGKAHVDFNSHIIHAAPNSTSRLEARAVIDGWASSLHHGRIVVEKEGKGANSYFSSRNLMLSETGKADSIPKLEIETDEVVAGHGATASAVDEEAIFYMMSRGFRREDAIGLFVSGFLAGGFERFPELEKLMGKEHVA